MFTRRSVARAALAFAAALACTTPASARATIGRIGLYTNENRAGNTVLYAGAPTEFSLYVFVLPGENGMMAAEFAVGYPSNVIAESAVTNPLVTAALGDLASGTSVSFGDCRTEWTWTHKQRVFLLDTVAARITVVPHGTSGAVQLASCETGYPLEPLAISSYIGLNEVAPPDTSPPVLLGARCLDQNAVELDFSEELLESSAEDTANYEVLEYGNPSVTIPVAAAIARNGGITVRLYLSRFLFGGRAHVVRVSGVCDVWGNEIAAGSEAVFVAVDLQPPKIVGAYAPNDSMVIAVFNEALSPATAENPANYRIYNIDGSPCASVPGAATLIAPDSVLLSFGEPKLPTLVQLTLRVTNVEDLAGNVISIFYNGATFVVPDPYPPYLVWAHAASAILLDVQFNKAVTAASASAAGNYEIFEAADTLVTVPISGVTVASSTRVRLALGSALSYDTLYVLRARDIEDIFGHRMERPDTLAFVRLDRDPPIALSARAIMARLLEIAFNERLDETSAETTHHYTLSADFPPPISVAAAELSASGDTVRLSLSPPLVYDVEYGLRIGGVRDLKGNTISTTDFTICLPDTFPPQLIAVEPTDPRTVRLAFDETLDVTTAERESNYVLAESDNPSRSVPISEAALLVDRTRVQLALAEDLEHARGYTIGVSNVTDVRGNAVPPGTNRSFVYLDAVPPSLLGAFHLDSMSVMAAFSEPLDTLTAQAAGNYRLCELLDPDHALPIVSATLVADSANVRLVLGERLRMLAYELRVSGVADRHGNLVAANSTVTFAVPDTIPPALVNAAAPGPRTVDLAFDERLAPAPALNTANYTLFATADTTNVIAITDVTLSGDSAGVRLSLGRDLEHARSYTIRVFNVSDARGNVVPPGTSRSLVYLDTVPPSLLDAAATSLATVRVRFDEPLDPTGAEAAGSYAVFESLNPSATIPVAAAVLAEDSSIVLLTLGGVLQNTGYGLRVNGVADKAMNPIAPNSTVAITVPDLFPPYLVSVGVETRFTVKAVFNEEVSASTAADPANYRIIEQSADPDTTVPLSAALLAGGASVRLALPSPLALGRTYVLQASAVEDLAGNPMPHGSEMGFACPASFPDAGIGVYGDLSHSSTVLRVDGAYYYPAYVWCRPGAEGLTAARFALSIPQGVTISWIDWNGERVSTGQADLQTGFFSAALYGCTWDWVWICRLNCRFSYGYLPLVIAVSESQPPDGRAFWTCAPGNPAETPVILSSLLCEESPGVETLLESESVTAGDGYVDVTWRLSRLDDGITFSVARFEGDESAPIALEGPIVSTGLSFSYRDTDIAPGRTYRYRISYTDGNGSRLLFESESVTVPAAGSALDQNRPNPFNPSTTIDYFVPRDGQVALEIFDVAGRRVACLVNESQKAGRHSAVWNGVDDAGRAAAAGIYICRLTACKETLSRKMILLR